MDPRVSDIRLLESDDAQLAGRDVRLARFLCRIVTAASLLTPGQFQLSDLCCRRRPNRRRCGGKIRLGRDLQTDDIQWSCHICEDRGVITNWQRSRWDLRPALKGGRVVSLSAERARRTAAIAPVRARAYDLSVELVHAPLLIDEQVVRQIRLGGEITLHDLHLCLHSAFDRCDDQPYEFMFGPPYDPETRRFGGSGRGDDTAEGFWDTRLVRMDSLGLQLGDSFGYLYDFNNEWVHRVSVVNIRDAACSALPRVIERVGASPAWPPECDPELHWQELESSCPMSSLYGPYLAEEPPQPSDWLALDDLERQLLVLEAHARSGPAAQGSNACLLLHALLHSLAETHLCERAGDPTVDELRCAAPSERHDLIHQLGTSLVRQQLDASAQPAAPCGSGARARRKRTKER